jgi:alcohol dehydrogenase class IV
MKAYEFLEPSTIIYGENALEKATDKIKRLGKKALVVSDKVMTEIGNVKKVTDILEKQKIKSILYNEVNTEPEDNFVRRGAEIYQNNSCDFLIALGGGSPIDAAKAIGAIVTNSGEIADYMGIGKITKALPPLVAIPTTAGTGSEVTRFTIISDTTNNVKMLIGSEYLIPRIAIVDPMFTVTMPANTVAATGIDALTHAIEAYTSVKHQPLSDIMALSAIKRIARYLPRSWSNSSDIEARSEMMLAAMEAGIAFNNSSVTIVHGMSRPIGALFHVPHGISNAVLLATCMKFAIMGTPERFADVSKAMGVNTSGLSVLDAAKKGVLAVQELCDDVKIPTITGLGIDADEFMAKSDKMASDALASGSPNNTVRTPTKEQIIELYKNSL